MLIVKRKRMWKRKVGILSFKQLKRMGVSFVSAPEDR